MFLPKLREHAWQEILGRADHPDIELAGLQAAKTGDQILGIAHRREHPPRMPEHVLPDHGERHLPAGAIEQRQPDFRLELLDLHRYGGSGELQLLRGSNEAQVAGDRGKDAQLA